MKILIVDDENESRALVRRAVEAMQLEGKEVQEATSGEAAAARLVQGSYDVVITDLVMEGMDGLKVLKAAKDVRRDTQVVLVTAYATIESAVKAIKAGAFDYISKPVNPEEVQHVIHRIVERQNLLAELDRLRLAVESQNSIENIVGDSDGIRTLKKMIVNLADSDSHVLITGETGTGKELVARAIHGLSTRKQKLMVSINCAALPENLLESELFGYRKGAFTGAASDKRGLLEEASGSTLFLDEIGELPLSLQAKLLRVLDSGEYRKLGDVRTHKVDLRIVAATNLDVERALRENKFREDLYYRLTVFHLIMPPLRERVVDIPLLVQHFVGQYARKFGKPVEGVSPDGLRCLEQREWGGNVRELEHVIERAVILAVGNIISMNELSQIVGIDRAEKEEVILPLSEVEKNCIMRALHHFKGQKDKTAHTLGISPATLWRKLKEYGIQASSPAKVTSVDSEDRQN
ncbi:MAG: sigma-54-dependent Fis family transcriptional regulator [Nitrospirae bacterium]|nr:sigma-54-dependent Fis family transcriptional regulator [Nitrospirota bacterium]